MMNAIGGTSIHYWAQSWRLKAWDFKTRSETLRRYGAAAIPVGTTLEDWPLTYDELAPFYDVVEDEVGVSGVAGNIGGKLTGRGNPFESPRAKEYPMPPLRGSGFTDHMAETARKLGWKPFAPPAAINSQPRKGRSSCVYHGYCGSGGCHVSAKGSTAVTTIPEAQKTKNLTIFDKAHVTRIETDANGRVTGVRYLRNREEFFQPAKVVLLAGYTYENSRLLLLSKSKPYPKGLSNNHGQVGRHYFGHWNSFVTALFPYDINTWYGLPAQGTTCDEWADDNFDHSGMGFIGGSSLHVMTERHPIDAAAMNTFGRAPGWGSAWKNSSTTTLAGNRIPTSRPTRFHTKRCISISTTKSETRLVIRSAASTPEGCERMNASLPSMRTIRWSSGSRPPARSKWSRLRHLCRVFQPTPTAAHAWATMPTPTLSIAGDFPTKRRISAS